MVALVVVLVVLVAPVVPVVVLLDDASAVASCASRSSIRALFLAFQCRDGIHGCQREGVVMEFMALPRGMLLDHTCFQASAPATPTVNSATALMTPHVLPGFYPQQQHESQ
jgi:hypothetical protein